MNTNHRPAPGTRSLMSSLSTDQANAVRIAHNQRALEKSGHVQAVPMTSKGLDIMRAAVSAHIQRATLGNPAAMVAASVVLPKVTEQVAKLAAAFHEQMAVAFRAIKSQMLAPTMASVPDKAFTKSVMTSANDVGVSAFSAMRQMLQEQRQLHLEKMRNQQQRPV